MNSSAGKFLARLAASTLLAASLPVAVQGATSGEATLRLECGGIGLEESQRMRAEVTMHALTLFFSTTGGGFITDVMTRVDDPLGDRRVEVSCGPIGHLDVPKAGRYRITATYAGAAQEHWVELTPGGGARLSLRWAE